MHKLLQTTVLVVIINCLFTLQLRSQVKVTGNIIDKENKPIEFAEILLLTKDSVAVKNQFSDEQGNFSIETKQENYILHIKNFQGLLYRNNRCYVLKKYLCVNN